LTTPKSLWLLPLGALIAFVGAMTGVGGGVFAVPLLFFVWKLELKIAVGTALVLVGANAFCSTVVELLHPQCALRPDLIAALVVGTLVGNQVGHRIARAIDTRLLARIFAVVLVVTGLRLLFQGPSAAAFEGVLELGPAQLAYAAVFGLLGGIVAPLFGVGGGLVMVPGLLFALPGLGFPAVRAASMATSVVSAARSAWLHHGDGRVRWNLGLWLGSGALLGSVGGVLVAHSEGFEAVGRPLLGVVLLGVALRFALESARPKRT